MQVPARPSVAGGNDPSPEVMERLERTGVLVGDGGVDLVLGEEGMNALHGLGGLEALGFQPQPSAWQNLWQSIIGGWSATGQQVVLNQNQAKIAETTPHGSVVYQPTAAPGTLQPRTPGERVIDAGQSVTNTLLIVAGAVVLLMVMQRR